MASSNVQACSYQPLPHELGYYESLFVAADQARTGQLNGRQAVDFLSRSKLPVDLLKHIWTVADQNPRTNTLDKAKFYVSVRLIQFYQNGQRPNGPMLECADPSVMMRPPYFEGVTGVSAQPFAQQQPQQQQQQGGGGPTGSAPPSTANSAAASAPSVPSNPSTPARRQSLPQQTLLQQQQQQQQPPPPSLESATPQRTTIPPTSNGPPPPQPQPQQQQQQQRALAAQDPYAMLPTEQVRYEDLFPQYATDGYVYGKQAVDLFSKSGLGKEILRDIWNLVDNPVDNRLSRIEFAVAMHLIICVSKKNLPLPQLLPPSLQELKEVESSSSSSNTAAGMGAAAAAGGGGQNAVTVAQPTLTNSPPSQGQLTANQPPPPTQQQQQQQPPLSQTTMALGVPQPRMSISEAFNDLSPVESPPLSPATIEKPAVQLPPTQQQLHQQPTQPQLQHPQQQQQQHPQQQPQPQLLPPQGVQGQPSYSQTTPQPPPPDNAQQPPPEISINDDTKYHPSSPALSSLPQNSVVPELPNLGNGVRAMSPDTNDTNGGAAVAGATGSGSGTMTDLENCRTILQKLQAENISLKAQLGQYTDEECKVQQIIQQTVAEIGSLSQELTGLRNQVVEAKASLIEATSELKAQIEKRE